MPISTPFNNKLNLSFNLSLSTSFIAIPTQLRSLAHFTVFKIYEDLFFVEVAMKAAWIHLETHRAAGTLVTPTGLITHKQIERLRKQKKIF